MIIVDGLDLGTPLSNTIPADTTQTYDSSVTYALKDEVEYSNNIYVSVSDSNAGNQPDVSPIDWLYKSKVNEYKWDDTKINTQSEGLDTFSLTFTKPQKGTYLALLGLEADNVTVEIFDNDDNVIFTQNDDVSFRRIWGWSTFFSEPVTYKHGYSLYLPYTNLGNTIKITLNNPTKLCKLGGLVIGTPILVGDTQWSPTSKIIDYSKKNVDTFGNTELIQGQFVKVFDISVQFDSNLYDKVNDLLITRRGTLTLFVGDDRDKSVEAFFAYGFFEDYTMTLDSVVSDLKIKINGVA